MLENNVKFAGYIPDEVDSRDYIKELDVLYKSNMFPTEWSMYKFAPMPVSQGRSSACTAFAGMSFVYTLTKRMMGKGLLCNAWELYAQTRMLSGMFPVDGGARPRDLMKVLHGVGVVPSTFSYKSLTKKPEEYKGNRFKLHNYQRVVHENGSMVEQVMNLLHKEELPVLLGISLPLDQINRIARGDTGHLIWTGEDKKNVSYGNHMMTIVGWDEKRFMCWNSWGREAGLHGYIWVDKRYINSPDWVTDVWTADSKHA